MRVCSACALRRCAAIHFDCDGNLYGVTATNHAGDGFSTERSIVRVDLAFGTLHRLCRFDHVSPTAVYATAMLRDGALVRFWGDELPRAAVVSIGGDARSHCDERLLVEYTTHAHKHFGGGPVLAAARYGDVPKEPMVVVAAGLPPQLFLVHGDTGVVSLLGRLTNARASLTPISFTFTSPLVQCQRE